MLSHEETMILIAHSKEGDDSAKEKLLEHNSPLLKSIIRRFNNKGVEYDDLYQIACVGFLKAIKNFDMSFKVMFSTYAVPMICGEIKRYMRDDGYIKVSRSLKVLAIKINRYIQEYKTENQKEPVIEDIAKKFEIDAEEVVYALDSQKMPISIYEKNDESEDKAVELVDRLQSKDDENNIIDKIDLKTVIGGLNEREKKIIILRFFRDKTQSEIAKTLGVSQVQVSRLETKILEKMRINY